MQLAMYHPSTSAVWAEALFVPVPRRSGRPGGGQVGKAVAAAARARGSRGRAERVAGEFGDRPETAVERMCRARAVAGEMFAPPQEPARDRARRRPGRPVAGPRRRQLART
jgi:hypothetical protein